MSGGQNDTPCGWQADTGQGNGNANSAGTYNVAQAKGHAKRAGLYYVTPEGGETFTIEAKVREAWTPHSIVFFAASLDPAALASLGVVSTRIWGALT